MREMQVQMGSRIKLVEGFMRYFGCSIKKLTSVLIRPGSMVRIHHGPFVFP